MRDIGSKFLNNIEISAQGAVYIVLQLPMGKASCQFIFIDTSPPEERVELLKPINDMKIRTMTRKTSISRWWFNRKIL